MIRFITFLFILLFFPWYSYGAQGVALVIGNGKYGIESSPLKDAPNDAALMAKVLRSLDFEVIEKINADQRTMKNLIREFGEKLKQQKNTVGLFYYSGHGMQVNGRNYMIPISEKIEDESDVEDAGVEVNYVLTKMHVANNTTNIVILDACRNNPYEKSFKSLVKGLNSMDVPKGTLIAFAAEPHKVALQGPGIHSYFTESLANEIVKKNISAIEVFRNVRKTVVKETGGKQFPVVEDRLLEAFYFGTISKGVKQPTKISSDKKGSAPKHDAQLSSIWLKQPDKNNSPIKESLLSKILKQGYTEKNTNKTKESFVSKFLIPPDKNNIKEVVRDSRTGLMWTSTDNGSEITWDAANRYCNELRLGGYTDWKLPTLPQLKSIYDRNNISGVVTVPWGTYKIRTIKGIHLSQYLVWTAKDEKGYARDVNFDSGEVHHFRPENINKVGNIALCVRK